MEYKALEQYKSGKIPSSYNKKKWNQAHKHKCLHKNKLLASLSRITTKSSELIQMRLSDKYKTHIKNYPLNGTLTNIPLTEGLPKENSNKFVKLLISYLMPTEDQPTIKWFLNNHPLKAPTELSTSSLVKTKWSIRMKKSSLKLISLEKRKTIIKF